MFRLVYERMGFISPKGTIYNRFGRQRGGINKANTFVIAAVM